MSDFEVREAITREVFERAKGLYLSVPQKKQLVDSVFNSMRRLDILQPMIDDDTITEIMVNGTEEIFIEREGRVSKVDVRFESIEKLENVIQSIVSKVNRTVNESSPIVDARLEDGSRVNVVLPPIALNGPVLTIRKFPKAPMTIEQLIGSGSVSEEAALHLEGLVKAKYNIFICGGTGSGKTTLLNVLSNFIPKDERIITVEDSAELQIRSIKNLVRMEKRNPNTEGKGEVAIRDLIRTSLRMRPERIIVGEVRGEEALDMLQAMNTGHDGSLSTGHANSAEDMIHRLATMVLSGAALPLEAIMQQIASAIEVIVHVSRLRDKSRRVVEITEIAGYKDGHIVLNPLYVFEEEDVCEEVNGQLKRTANKMIRADKFRLSGIKCEGLM